ncbi:MAG: iron ABC transporter permease [bacterium]|nr:iron ABC transporter permease [bacterium]
MNSLKNTRKGPFLLIGMVLSLLVILGVSILIAVTIGTTSIPITSVYKVIGYELFHIEAFKEFATGPVHDIVWMIRLPRIILAIPVGMGLAVTGTVMQAIVKNPIADPYILGVSSGASLGATAAILLGVGAIFGNQSVGIVAFLGAFLVSILVVACANIGGRANSVKLLLVGTGISSICSAFSSFIVYLANNKEGIQSITYWLMGSLAGAKAETNAVVVIIVLVGTAFFCTQFRTLNLMLLGDQAAITLGTDLQRYRYLYLLISSLMVGVIVYASGMIGFVGLLIPHMVRVVVGNNHKNVLPIASLVGAIFMIWADVGCRSILPNSELPIGILTSMIGGPCFLYLCLKKTYGLGGSNT